MSRRWSPCPRTVFIRRLRRLGFEGPLPGGNHEYMASNRTGHRIVVFSNRFSNRDYSVDQARRLLRQVEKALSRPVTLQEWIGLGK